MEKHFKDFNNDFDKPDYIEPDSVSEFLKSREQNGEVNIDSEGIREVLKDLGFPTNEVE